MLTVNSRPLSLSKFIGAPNMIQISKRLYATSAAVFTYNDLQAHYANISREVIKTFLKLCEHCTLKKKRSELSKLVIKPVRSSDFSSRGQVDLIDQTIMTLAQ
jgi:hypothetical protein